MKKIILLLFLFTDTILLFGQSYSWDIMKKNGEIIYHFESAQNVRPFGKNLLLIDKGRYSKVLDNSFREILIIDNNKYEITKWANLIIIESHTGTEGQKDLVI